SAYDDCFVGVILRKPIPSSEAGANDQVVGRSGVADTHSANLTTSHVFLGQRASLPRHANSHSMVFVSTSHHLRDEDATCIATICVEHDTRSGSSRGVRSAYDDCFVGVILREPIPSPQAGPDDQTVDRCLSADHTLTHHNASCRPEHVDAVGLPDANAT